MSIPVRSITNLPALIAALPEEDQARFRRIYHVDATVGEILPPPSMEPWIEQQFGSVEAVRRQPIVKVTNLITLEGALFNGVRAHRPIEAQDPVDLERIIAENVGDPFCRPLDCTPADVFGRVRGERCITASNVAKYDGFHSVLIFDEHHPLRFTRADVHDAVDTALAWARQAHNVDKEARYFFFMWNCLWRSGASIIHGHAQAALTRGMHYAKVEHWRRAALLYKLAHGVNYFDDLVAVHQALGLVVPRTDARIVVPLTPIRHQEVLILAPKLSPGLLDAMCDTLDAFIHRLGTTAFNLALYVRPIDHVEEDWNGFPAIVRLVDRGNPANRNCDLGVMELYGSSVIAGDPFQVVEALREHISAKDEG